MKDNGKVNHFYHALTPATASWHPKNFFYGYFWYQTNIVINDKNYSISKTWGAGGNRIILCKELDLVIVITGHDRKDDVFDTIAKRIVPTFAN